LLKQRQRRAVPLGYEMSFGRMPIACLTVHYATRLRRSRTTMTAEGLCGIVEDAREIAGKYAEFDRDAGKGVWIQDRRIGFQAPL
jgi:hypothetical protein